MAERTSDLVVIGSGVAGLTAALVAAREGAAVTVLTAGEGLTGSSPRAQGGVAAALGEDDTVELHVADTMAVGGDLNDRHAVEVLVEEGRTMARWLLDEGVPFDGGVQHPEMGLEAGHSRRRILHAGGGATGWAVTQKLWEQAAAEPRITIENNAKVTSLSIIHSMLGQRPVARTADDRSFPAKAVVLATGGYAALWSRTTNGPENTGSGHVLALVAGARLADLEFVQFHPTALEVPGLPAFLLTEALRGEGARVVNAQGKEICNPLLARDIVARAIYRYRRDQGQTYLSLQHLEPGFVRGRFPNLDSQLKEWGLDLARDLLPISPAAHYCMGGVRTDDHGRTDVAGLYAAGEVACTGVQGANRLASNSLLECLVFGARSARAALHDGDGVRATWDLRPLEQVVTDNSARSKHRPAAVGAARAMRAGTAVDDPPRTLDWATQWFAEHAFAPVADSGNESGADVPMWRRQSFDRWVGLERDGRDLAEFAAADRESRHDYRDGWLQFFDGITGSALLRAESRGAHYRSDFPDTDPRWRGRIHVRGYGAWQFEEVH